MAVTTHEEEITCSIPPARFFKAFVLDMVNLVPKVLHQAITSVEHLEGNGGPGTINLITYREGDQNKTVKERVDAIDEASCTYSYTIIEGDFLGDELESVSNILKIEASADGGSICKLTATYHSKGVVEKVKEKIKQRKEMVNAIFKAIESYLHSNPHEYN